MVDEIAFVKLCRLFSNRSQITGPHHAHAGIGFKNISTDPLRRMHCINETFMVSFYSTTAWSFILDILLTSTTEHLF